MTITIGQIKIVPRKGDLAANHDILMNLLRSGKLDSADIVVTPECFLDGYVCTEDWATTETMHNYSIDPSTSEYTTAVSRWAAETKTWVIFGCMRYDDTGVYDSSLAYDREGNLAGYYDKVHCQTHDKKYQPGGSLPVYCTEFGTFGMMICADRRWPETVRTLCLKGAEVLFNPTYGMHDDLNLMMMRTRSYESEVFIAFTHPRQSLVTGPTGDVIINNTSASEDYTLSEIDLSEVDRVRSGKSAHLRDRRSEIYAT